MSRFFIHNNEPNVGDLATTSMYGEVRLINQLSLVQETSPEDNIWVVRDDNDELHLIRQEDLTDVGYYVD